MSASLRRLPYLLSAAGLALLLSGCAPSHLITRPLADALASQGSGAEDDLELAREASSFYLKLSESVLKDEPTHRGLAVAVASGFTQYAYAFVADEADRLEARDTRGAAQLRERAARLYQRGRDHALKALSLRYPDLMAQLALPEPSLRIEKADVPLAYWGAAAWGGLVSLSKDKPEVVADLPLAVNLACLAWQQDPGFGDGNLASLMGSFEAARPGGSRSQATAYFDEALRLADGRSAGAFVAKAEGVALPAGDRAQFESLLKAALAVQESAGSPLTLSNQLMRRRARWLLDSAEDLF